MKDFNRFGLVWGIHVCLLVSVAAGYSGGDGSEGYPYKISSVADWQELIVASTAPDEHFILTEDLDFGGADILPVGYEVSDPNFFGQFDGQGFAIRNAAIYLPSQDYVGLFGRVGSGGKICNLNVVDADITGRDYVGGLAGHVEYGTLSGCSATGSVSGTNYVGGLAGYVEYGTLSSCCAAGSVSGSGDYVGGLVGRVEYGTLSSCSATGSVSGDWYVGGLVGHVYSGTLSSCYATGSVSGYRYVGGLAGYNDRSQVIHCYSTGRPSGSDYVGGLCGYKTTDFGYADTGNFWDTESSQITVSAMGVGKTTAPMKLLSTFVDAGWDFGVPGQAGVWSMLQDSYPVLSWQLNEPSIPIAMPDVRGLSLEDANSVLTAAGLEIYKIEEVHDLSIDAGLISCSIPVSGAIVYPELTRIHLLIARDFHYYSGGDGSEGNPYKISTVADWQELIVASTAPDEHYILTEDLDFGGAEILPVGYEVADPNFFGQFDGQGFAIRNAVIYLPHQDYVGLFSSVGVGGNICNLNVVDADITGRDYVGGLAGRVEYGTLSSCSATGSVNGNSYVGGLVGHVDEGTLSGCYAAGSVSGNSYVGGLVGGVSSGTLSACFATGSVSGGYDVGGLVGRVSSGTLSSCYAAGSVSGDDDYVGGMAGYNFQGKVIHCYSTGRPSGTSNVGGLCGGKTTGVGYEDTGNFWDAESSQTTVSAMGLGKTTAPMKLLSTFMDAGWDFGVPGQAGVWSLPQDSYPVLSWQLNEPPIPIAMPDVRGLSLEDANSVLTAAGLEVYGVDEIFDLSIDAGLISCSIPVSGAAVYPELTRIYLRVAKDFYYSGGDGSEGDPYKISTVADWQELIVASTAPNEHFILTEDLDFGGAEIKPVGYMASDLNFYGQFDGQGFAIRNAAIFLPNQDYVGLFGRIGSGGNICNLNVVDADITGGSYVGGLAGRVEYGTLSSCCATGSVSGSRYYVGGLVGGVSFGTLSSCCATGSVSGGGNYVGGLVGIVSSGTLSSCSATGSVSGDDDHVGGLVGHVDYGTLSGCYAIGSVRGGDGYTGGLAGYVHSGTLSSCCATGSVNGTGYAGGLVGRVYSGTLSVCCATGSVNGTSYVGGLVGGVDKGTLSSCYATGSVSGTNYVGGLAGFNKLSKVIHCYSTGRPSGSNDIGGLCGGKTTGTGYADTGNFWDAESSQITVSAMGVGKTTAQMKLLSTFMDAGWDFEVPGQAGVWSLPQDSYPVLSWQLNEPIPIAMPDVRGLSFEDANSVLTAAGWEVYGVDEIFDLSIDAGLISYSIPVSGTAVYPELTRIYLRVAKDFHYSGGDGSEGDPYKISTVADWQELIAASAAPDEHFILTEDLDFGGAEIKPVGYMASDLNFYGQFDGQGFAIRDAAIFLPHQDYVGLFGRVGSGGKICNLNVVDIDITGRDYVGGLAGRVEYGTLSSCCATGSVSGSRYYVGGLVGRVEYGTLSACYATGSVRGNSIVGGLAGYNYRSQVIHCYSTGRPSGSWSVGGLCGYRITGAGYADKWNFWDKESSQKTWSAMGVGKTTGEMKTLSTFVDAGWDFEETWAMCEGTNYPRLQWQIPAGDWVCPDGVAMEDLDYFAIRWLMADCAASGDCDGADLDGDGAVDLADWAVFAEQWLGGI